MKRVLGVLLSAMLIASLSLVVSCQKKEEPTQTGEQSSSYSEEAAGSAEKAMKEATESGEKAMKEATEAGEKAMKDVEEKAGGYGM